ncbi:hypothetical protein N825_00955 [Skermanella stibiiresistens SB22]|uniref:Uncharacterized protein n=1 Tax=Skermanella stibiiresistens SB22 TaxID=1385369 RepID=W9HFY6_9PROT|nr:hypothetical protein N825_00955 [Skermanella stibiiresistens SB22]
MKPANVSVVRSIPDVVEALTAPIANHHLVLVIDAANGDIAIILEEHTLERLSAPETRDWRVLTFMVLVALRVEAIADRIDQVLPHDLQALELLDPYGLLVHDHRQTDLDMRVAIIA